MELILKAKTKIPIDDRYAFPTTAEMRRKLHELKARKVDVNEMFRRYAAELIAKAEASLQDESA